MAVRESNLICRSRMAAAAAEASSFELWRPLRVLGGATLLLKSFSGRLRERISIGKHPFTDILQEKGRIGHDSLSFGILWVEGYETSMSALAVFSHSNHTSFVATSLTLSSTEVGDEPRFLCIQMKKRTL